MSLSSIQVISLLRAKDDLANRSSDMLEWLGVHNPSTLQAMVMALTNPYANLPPVDTSVFYTSPEQDKELRTFARNGDIVGAIKYIRTITGWGLIEAKRYYDLHYRYAIQD